jgi:hypothetical protein
MTACAAKFFEQRDLVVGKGSDLLPIDADHANRRAVLAQGNREHGARSANINEGAAKRIA